MAALGCAYQDATIRASAPERARVLGAAAPGGPAIVLHEPFVDERADRSRCGVKRVGDGETAVVRCGDPPSQWLGHSLARELRANGFRVYENEAPPDVPALRIEGYLEYLFIENQFEARFTHRATNTPEADLAVRLVAHGARFEAQRRFYIKGAGRDDGGLVERNYQEALDNAVRGSLEHMVFAIGELVASTPRFEAAACSVGARSTAPSETR